MGKRVLHNKVNKKELKEEVKADHVQRTTISFYKYTRIPDPLSFRDSIFDAWEQLGVLGRVYLAQEGINAQISVPTRHFDAFKEILYGIPALNGVRLNLAIEDNGKSFYVLKIKVREKIVADGLDDDTFDPSDTGNYLSAEAFNKLTDKSDTVLVDMRNHYESEVGHFKGAICPDVDTFRDSLPIIEDMLEPHKEQDIVMYCTGGIRCEKATAYFKHKGFKNIHHLEGGIIKYVRDAENEGVENKFLGKNFVFDDRMGERISEDVIAECHQCGKPADTHTNCANDACHILFIQCEECAAKYKGCCSSECQDFISLPVDKQKELRKGMKKGDQIYRKGRLRPKLQDLFKQEDAKA